MYCRKCGKEIADSATFCKYCGTKIVSKEVGILPDFSDEDLDEPELTRNSGDGLPKTVRILMLALAVMIAVIVVGLFLLFSGAFNKLTGNKNGGSVEEIEAHSTTVGAEGDENAITDEELKEQTAEGNSDDPASAQDATAENPEAETEENQNTDDPMNDQAGAEEEYVEDTAIHRYELIKGDVTWKEAFDDCMARGGYLVHINTPEEYDAVVSQIRSEDNGISVYWIGAARSEEFALPFCYYWIKNDGTASGDKLNDSQYWLEGEPSYTGDDGNGGEYSETCVDMIYMKSSDRYVWNDVPNNLLEIAPFYQGEVGYICEYEN